MRRAAHEVAYVNVRQNRNVYRNRNKEKIKIKKKHNTYMNGQKIRIPYWNTIWLKRNHNYNNMDKPGGVDSDETNRAV